MSQSETHTLVLAPDTVDETTLDASLLLGLNATKIHTGLSDWQANIPTDYSLEDRLSNEVYIRNSQNELIFRGYFEHIENSVGPSERGATISGHGIGTELTKYNASVNFQNVLASDAWTDFLANTVKTDIPNLDVTVVDPSATQTTTDYEAQSASSTSEFEGVSTISDDTPVSVFTDEIGNTEINFVLDALADPGTNPVETIGSTGFIDDDAYNTGQGITLESGTGVVFTVEFDHRVPSENVVLRNRDETRVSGDRDVIFSWDGTEVGNLVASGTVSLSWRGRSGDQYELDYDTEVGQDIQPGETHEYKIINNGADPYTLDVVSVYDDRYEGDLQFPNPDAATNAGGILDGPEKFASVEFEFDTASVPWAITDISLTSTWDDTGNAQRMQTRIEDGTWGPTDGTEDNTTSVTFSPEDDVSPSEVGSSVQARVRFSRQTSDTSTIPATGDTGQRLESLTIDIDGDDRPLFNDVEFSGDYLEIAQRMADRSNMRFWIDHEEDSIPITVARLGDQSVSLPSYSLKNETRTRDIAGDFWNVVYIEGARISGTRITTEQTDSDSINKFGRVQQTFDRPDIKNQDDLELFARQQLSRGLQQEERTGSVTVSPPINQPAGPSTTIEWSDGLSTTPAIEEIEYSVSSGGLEGVVKFDIPTLAIEKQTTANRFEIGSTKRGF